MLMGFREANQRLSKAIERMVAEGRVRLAEIPGPVRRGRWKPIRIKGNLSAALRSDRDAR